MGVTYDRTSSSSSCSLLALCMLPYLAALAARSLGPLALRMLPYTSRHRAWVASDTYVQGPVT